MFHHIIAYLCVAFIGVVGGYYLGNKYPWSKEVTKVEDAIKNVKL